MSFILVLNTSTLMPQITIGDETIEPMVIYQTKPVELSAFPRATWLNCWLHNLGEISQYDFTVISPYLKTQKGKFSIKVSETGLGTHYVVSYRYYWVKRLCALLGLWDDNLYLGKDFDGKEVNVSCFADSVD